MNVLVTGGAGFIGSNLVQLIRLKKPEWNVTVVDALTYAGNLASLEPLVSNGEIQFKREDIADLRAMKELFVAEKFDLVFHLAAESHVDRSIHDSQDFVRTNVLGTQCLIDAFLQMRSQGSSADEGIFVHISTDEVYGSCDSGAFSEKQILDPSSPYSASKAASDLLVMAAVKTHGIRARITRCTNNYGPFQFPEKFIPVCLTRAFNDQPIPLYGDGLYRRNWIHVEDHCLALLAVAEKGSDGEIYNIGGTAESEKTNRDVVEMILDTLGKPKSLIERVGDRPAHDRRYAVDCTKIFEECEWQPRREFVSGLASTIEWYAANQAWWKEILSGEYMDYYKRNYGAR